MKKSIKLVALAVLCSFASTGNLNAQVLEEGDKVVDVYYGFPNLYTSAFKTAYASDVTDNSLKVGGIGPVGARFEYMVSDKIGLGVDIGFNQSKITYTESGYKYEFSTQKLGVMATFNFHFLERNDKLDLYGVFGIGYGDRSYNFSSTEPGYTPTNITSLIPVASRIGVGMRYMFTDNLGANLGLGFGHGGLVNAGLSFKF